MNILPKNGWALCEEVSEDTAAAYATEMVNKKQLYKVLAISESRVTEFGAIKESPAKVGDIVFVEPAAGANTPAQLLKLNKALIPADRIMAVVEGI